MPRVSLEHAHDASGRTGEVFADIQQTFGMVPNLFQAYAHRPEVLEANWNKVKAVLFAGELPPTLKQMIAVVVSQANGCRYCVNAHSTALKMMGVPREQVCLLSENLEAAEIAPDAKAVLRLAVKSTREPQTITDEEIEHLRTFGYGDAHIVEMFSVVDLFTSFNKFLDTLGIPNDFPAP